MKRQFIPDREIVLSQDTDLLNTSIYANNLVDLIKSAPQGQVFNIGLFGSWGSGKSSIIATAKEQLTSSKDSKVKFITYDAWKYANDSFRRMFLFEVQKELGFKRTPLMEKFYQNSNQDVDVKNQISPLKVFLIATAIVIGVLLVSLLNIKIEYKISIYSLVALFSVLMGIITGCFNQLKVAISKPFMFAPEQFEQCFQEMMEEALKPNIIQRAFQFITRTPDCILHKQIVIVIDNIDRCNSEQSYNLLTDIKTFLCDERFNIVFVIPVDDEALRKHILNTSHNNNTDECARDKEEFLRKFFNVTLRIKPHQPTEMYEFAQKLNTKYALDFNSATINIASKEYAKNPRRVIQLFNNLSAELANYDDEFASKYETLICKILIIREEYNDFYQELLKDYTLLSKTDFSDKKLNPELIRLLSDTRSYTSNYDGHVLSRILTNSDIQFADIPANIRHFIDAHNAVDITAELSEWLKTDVSNTEQFVGYCLYNIEKAIKRQLWDSEFKAYCEFIAEINSTIKFTKEQDIRFAEKFKPYIEKLIPTFCNPTQIVAYANYLQTQGLSFLLGYIISYIKSNKEKANDVWAQYLQECIDQCNSKTLVGLGEVFAAEYKKNKYDITSLNKDQLGALIKEDLLLFIIDRWTAIEENKYISDFIFISHNIGINKTVCVKVYDKLTTILGDLRGVVASDLLDKISIINKITENLSVEQNCESILKLYKLITGHRTMPNPSYSSYRQYDNQVRLLDECSDIDDVNVVARFIVTTYKVLIGRIKVDAELDVLMTKDATTTLNHILWLKNKWTDSLYPLASHLIKYSLYDNNELMAVYRSHFLDQYNDAPILKEEELKIKLGDMLQYAIQTMSDRMFNWLSDISSKDNRIKTILVPIISDRPIGEIQSLPKGLMDLAINSVDQNNIESYRKYTDFLRCLATSGSTAQKQYLVKLIVKMLDEKDDIQKVILIIKSYKQLAKPYCDRIESTLRCILDDTSDSSTIQLCNDAIEHLSSLNQTSKRKRKSA
ncbi:MAG: hypothetical protein IKV83_00765 [Muribaculaceae bacterium]|nr:hypothetical protein [Muribaculaceae bacterium]